jgi:hypothetical protein
MDDGELSPKATAPPKLNSGLTQINHETAKEGIAGEERIYSFNGTHTTQVYSSKTGRKMVPSTLPTKIKIKARSPEEAAELIKKKIESGVNADQRRDVSMTGRLQEIGHRIDKTNAPDQILREFRLEGPTGTPSSPIKKKPSQPRQ